MSVCSIISGADLMHLFFQDMGEFIRIPYCYKNSITCDSES